MTGVELNISVLDPAGIATAYAPVGLDQEDALVEDLADDMVDDLPQGHVFEVIRHALERIQVILRK